MKRWRKNLFYLRSLGRGSGGLNVLIDGAQKYHVTITRKIGHDGDDIFDWMKDHKQELRWDYWSQAIRANATENTLTVKFQFIDPTIAMLFKLTWGGQ